MVAAPRSMPKRAPKARSARISRIKTASTPPTPVLATRTAEPTAARTPSTAQPVYRLEVFSVICRPCTAWPVRFPPREFTYDAWD
ncbi:MAG: hypothetical protein JWR71_305 [Pseudarthrobacter sp.]|nr:hypothetical protein [Pseudarthrobacter sp.]